MKALKLFVLATIPLLALACASTAGTVGDQRVLTAEQITQSDARNALELIEHQRPRWLNQRFNRSLRLDTKILVYYNGTRLGGIEVLQDVQLQGVQLIRYVGSAEAGRLAGAGSDAVDAAILISSGPAGAR